MAKMRHTPRACLLCSQNKAHDKESLPCAQYQTHDKDYVLRVYFVKDTANIRGPTNDRAAERSLLVFAVVRPRRVTRKIPTLSSVF